MDFADASLNDVTVMLEVCSYELDRDRATAAEAPRARRSRSCIQCREVT